MKLSLAVLAVLASLLISQNASALERKLPKLKLSRPFELFPLREVEPNLTKRFNDESRRQHYRYEFQTQEKSKRTIAIHFEAKPAWSGIALLDAQGNTLFAVSPKSLTDLDEYENFAQSAGGVYVGDLNLDGKEDYYIEIYGRGAGSLTDRSENHFFLSSLKGYQYRSVLTAISGARHLVRFKDEKQCYFIVRNHAQAPKTLDLKKGKAEIPPLDKETAKEMTGEDGKVMTKETWASYITSQDLLFALTYPVLITGTSIVKPENLDPQLPLVESFFRHEAEGGSWGGETKLLSKDQKTKMLKKDLENSLNNKAWW